MATDDELKRAGIHLPVNADYIRDGDDAISANARVLWDRVEGVRTDTNGELSSIKNRIEPIKYRTDDEFAVTDVNGRAAFTVDEDGDVHLGATEVEERLPGFRVLDKDGKIAFEVDEHGRTRIYDSVNSTGDPAPATVHVFVAAGQSNMSGRGRPVAGPVSPRVLQFGANRRVIEPATIPLDMVDQALGTSPATFFAHNYLAAQPSHVSVLIVPAAKGGTAFSGSPEEPATGWTWTKGAAPDAEHALYERSVQQTLDAIAAAKAAGYHVVLKGILWHQGEGNGGMAANVYAQKLDQLIADYRTELDAPTLPFMVGRMSPEGIEDTPSKATVDEAHRDTPYRTPFTGFAPSTRDGHNNNDTTHFSTVGTAHLGDTYLTAYYQAVGNTRAAQGA